MRSRNGVSVVIPTLRPRFLRQCLAGLARQRSGAFEVIVVENGYRDAGTAKLVRDFGATLDICYLFEGAPGANRARNLGARAARFDVLAFLDDDCVPAPDWIESIMADESVRRGANVGGGRVELRFLAKPPAWFLGVFRESLSEIDLGPVERVLRGREYLVSANMFVSALVFRWFGGFEEKLGIRGREGPQLGNDEIELLGRLSRAGMPPRYCPRARVLHLIPPERVSVGRIAARRYGQGMSDIALMLHDAPGSDPRRAHADLVARHSREAWLGRLTGDSRDLAEEDAAVFRWNNQLVRRAYFAGLGRGLLDSSQAGTVGGDHGAGATKAVLPTSGADRPAPAYDPPVHAVPDLPGPPLLRDAVRWGAGDPLRIPRPAREAW